MLSLGLQLLRSDLRSGTGLGRANSDASPGKPLAPGLEFSVPGCNGYLLYQAQRVIIRVVMGGTRGVPGTVGHVGAPAWSRSAESGRLVAASRDQERKESERG